MSENPFKEFGPERLNVDRMFKVAVQLTSLIASQKARTTSLLAIEEERKADVEIIKRLLDTMLTHSSMVSSLILSLTEDNTLIDGINHEVAQVALLTQFNEQLAIHSPGFVASFLSLVDTRTFQTAIAMLKPDRRAEICKFTSEVIEEGLP